MYMVRLIKFIRQKVTCCMGLSKEKNVPYFNMKKSGSLPIALWLDSFAILGGLSGSFV